MEWKDKMKDLEKLFPGITNRTEIIKNSTLGINGKPIKNKPFRYKVNELKPFVMLQYWEYLN